MRNYVIQGPKVIWKAPPGGILSTRTKMFQAIVTESDANTKFEKITGINNLKPIAFLEQGIVVSKPVAHITLSDGGLATGFLISSDVLLTNWHVFGERKCAQGAKIRFNYQNDLNGNFLPTDEYECDSDSLKTNESLDYAIVTVKGSPGMKWGFLKLKPIDIQLEDKVNIIQHPAGGPKEIAMNDNEVQYVDETIVQYITDTLPGSSGSPVFNDNWQVIALHHSGGNIPEPSTNSIHFRNEGIKIGAIIKDLPASYV